MRTIAIVLVVLSTWTPVFGQTFTELASPFTPDHPGTRTLFGATAVDVNLDGRVDLYHPGRLYLQTDSLRFEDILESSQFQGPDGTEVFGGVFADVDGDHFPDLYIEDFDVGSRFFRNRFGIRWDLESPDNGIDMSAAQSQGASWGDYDQDGDLDLFVGEEFGGNKLFENIGSGRYRDAGLAGILNDRKSYGVAAADFDLDGDLDVYIAACSTGDPAQSVNSLFRNEGDGTFVDIGVQAQVADSLAGWAVVWTDFDRDRWPDIFVANMPIYGPNARPGVNKLYRNLGDGTFEDVSEAAGVAGDQDDWGFGASVADFDNDGWEDIYLANLEINLSSHRLLRNQGDGTFVDMMPDLGLLPIDGPIAVAVADLNADGWVDVALADRLKNRVFVNDGGSHGWLTLRLAGSDANSAAIGATVVAWMGGTPLYRQVTAGDGMTSQNLDLSIHYGLGGHATVDSLVISWPNGSTSRLEDVAANQHLVISQATGLAAAPPAAEAALVLPEDGVTLQGNAVFEWTTSAPVDDVSYTLAVLSLEDRSGSGELVLEGLTGTSVHADLSSLPDGEYVWTVVADGTTGRRGAERSRGFSKSAVTSTGAFPQRPQLEAFPNPFSDQLTVNGSRSSVLELIDVTGRTVLRTVMGGGPEVLAVGHLARGVYFLRVEGELGTGRSLVRF